MPESNGRIIDEIIRCRDYIQTREFAGVCLRVSFLRRGDRYAHVISEWMSSDIEPLLLSEEGGDEKWPPSPPMQFLSIEPNRDPNADGATPVALLVGMAGSSHWSMSVEAIDSNPSLQFDVACSVKLAPEHLGSTYRRCERAKSEFSLPIGGGPSQTVFRSIVPASREDVASETSENDELVLIRPCTVEVNKFPATIRWRYAISPRANTNL